MAEEHKAAVIAHPAAGTTEESRPAAPPPAEEDGAFLDRLAAEAVGADRLKKELDRILSELEVLRSENRWQEMVDLFHPVEERVPELEEAGLGFAVRSEIAFAMGHLGRHEEAIELALRCVEERPDDFQAHAGLAYAAYDSLYAAKNRRILLHPEEKKSRIELAHKHFAKAQELRPDGVTNFYRQGMLYKAIQNKPDRALPLFETAVRNWDRLDEGQKKARHQERKNFIKALYQAASCHQKAGRNAEALQRLERCIEEDRESGHLSVTHKYFALGKIHFSTGDYQKARHALEFAAAQADPADHDYVFELLARTALAQGAPDQARRSLERIPGNRRRPYVLWTEADLLLAEGKTTQARAVLKKAAEKDRRGRHKALLRLARLDFRENDYQACLTHCGEADRFCRTTYGNPCDEALFWKAAALLRLDRPREAWQAVRDLEAFRPRYPHLLPLKKKIAAELARQKKNAQREPGKSPPTPL
ncbi:MAG: tetratricopeptide repeat protein [Desulfacinum sp.]|jgi:tetratricopeptide (TPR) repeat protein|nr:tetratricopeptide repeat protein [Desulfacinum sp.]